MKCLKLTWFLGFIVLLLPSVLFAAEQHKSLTLNQPATIGQQELKAGDYTLRWDDKQDNTSVQFQSNGKTVATVQAQVVRRSGPSNASYSLDTQSHQLKAIYFKNEQLVLNSASASAQSDSTGAQ